MRTVQRRFPFLDSVSSRPRAFAWLARIVRILAAPRQAQPVRPDIGIEADDWPAVPWRQG